MITVAGTSVFALTFPQAFAPMLYGLGGTVSQPMRILVATPLEVEILIGVQITKLFLKDMKIL